MVAVRHRLRSVCLRLLVVRPVAALFEGKRRSTATEVRHKRGNKALKTILAAFLHGHRSRIREILANGGQSCMAGGFVARSEFSASK